MREIALMHPEAILRSAGSTRRSPSTSAALRGLLDRLLCSGLLGRLLRRLFGSFHVPCPSRTSLHKILSELGACFGRHGPTFLRNPLYRLLRRRFASGRRSASDRRSYVRDLYTFTEQVSRDDGSLKRILGSNDLNRIAAERDSVSRHSGGSSQGDRSGRTTP